MKPVIAIVGRPNVGKSTLFNRLTRSRDALVADLPGLTRDRHYGEGRTGERPYLVIDTGGFEPVAKDGILHAMAQQTLQAIAEADAVVFVVDGRAGLAPQDQLIAERLRKSGVRCTVAVNKAEGMTGDNRSAMLSADFHQLGLGDPCVISSAHGDGVNELIELVLEAFPEDEEVDESERPRRTKIAIVGRPNVGKSTLINTLVGEERVIAFDMPGTTRDAIEVEFDHADRPYTLIDTAGLRRRGKVFEAVEKFSVVKTLQAIADTNVVVLMLDAQQEISDQDAHIAGFVIEQGRAVVLAVNKWDGLDEDKREWVKRELARKMQFMGFAKLHFISALHNRGVGALMKSVAGACDAAFRKLSTPKLTRALQDAVAHQAPPRHGLSRPKPRYAHQGGMNPPIVVVHGTGLGNIPAHYTRYLEGRFRKQFSLEGTPLRIEYRSTANPFDSRERD
ncbi:ribosome biogenesis GTPase Der [Derxia lacustris]|uniref:ribosome biogenesis GTPase Der n=1 Tax=Derxia lacustris TaxID=764842 RepID=UPI000A173121|nr:ribosome biogenesis GTPase Der [Derxia lacustris]